MASETIDKPIPEYLPNRSLPLLELSPKPRNKYAVLYKSYHNPRKGYPLMFIDLFKLKISNFKC